MLSATNNKYIAVPLAIENMTFRGGEAWLTILGIHVLNGEIIYLYSGLQDVPLENPTKKTIFPQIIIADSFSSDFIAHSQTYVSYKVRQVLYSHYARSYIQDGKLFLNTLKNEPLGKPDREAFAKVFEIGDGSIREVGASPKPEARKTSDSRTHYFADYALRMASPFKLECKSISTDKIVWELRLTAYLYTEFELKSGILYFGTAGKGGRFYGVSLKSGHEIFSYDTGGTTCWEWYKGYVRLTDRKGDLLFLNPMDGTEMKRLHFRGLKTALGIVHENCIYTVVRDKANKLYALCAEIGDDLDVYDGGGDIK